MLTVLAFVVAIAVLVTVHEYGHYRMALACGIKVLRFSIGMGPTLWKWQRPGAGTEFVIAAIPIGGFVRMLDTREDDVAVTDYARAFDKQPLRARIAVVSAGPLANLLLAMVLFATVAWVGIEEPQAVLSRPPVDSVAYQAGLQSGDLVLQAGVDQDSLSDIQSFDELRWVLTQAVVQGHDVTLEIQPPNRVGSHRVTLNLASLKNAEIDGKLFRQIGISAPFTRSVISRVIAGGPADRAGLLPGDQVKQVDGLPMDDGAHLVDLIRSAGQGNRPTEQHWTIERGNVELSLSVKPDIRLEGESQVGRIDAGIGSRPAMVTVHRGPVDGLVHGMQRTWDMGVVSVQMLGKMLVGRASIKNLSGPLTIADYAGKSANMGLSQYLNFLAVISVSLGVLNLLPLPVLDGGHLMYYLWEGVTGKALSDLWLDRLQRGGIALLVLMMSVALFNDVARYLG